VISGRCETHSACCPEKGTAPAAFKARSWDRRRPAKARLPFVSQRPSIGRPLLGRQHRGDLIVRDMRSIGKNVGNFLPQAVSAALGLSKIKAETLHIV
jgi:hypothetical protein